MFLPQGRFSTEFPLSEKRHKRLDVCLDLWLEDKDYCVISINHICPWKPGGVDGGVVNLCTFGTAWTVVRTGSKFVELFLIGW